MKACFINNKLKKSFEVMEKQWDNTSRLSHNSHVLKDEHHQFVIVNVKCTNRFV